MLLIAPAVSGALMDLVVDIPTPSPKPSPASRKA